MGVLDFLRKKPAPKPGPPSYMDALKREIELHKQWIAYLARLQGSLQSSHESHRELTTKDAQDIKRWLVELHKRAGEHAYTVRQLQENMRATVEGYSRQMAVLQQKMNELRLRDSYMQKLVRDEVAGHMERVKAEATRDAHDKVKEHMQTHSEALQEVRQSHEEIKSQLRAAREKTAEMERRHKEIEDTAKPAPQQGELTNPEQKLLNLLLSEPDPVSYSAIAEKTGNSVNTVRVLMNNLKKRGLIVENILPSGVKLFSAQSREKIKKLYNLERL